MRLTRRQFLVTTSTAAVALSVRAEPVTQSADVCVYCGNASGVVAAVTAVKEGCSVLLIEPSRWLGGMTGGGLSHIDWGREAAVGGLARKLLKNGTNDAEYRKRFGELIKEHKVQVVYEHRVSAVKKQGARIESIELDHAPPDRFGCPTAEAQTKRAMIVTAKVFIDCSYEGDLMARAGVSYTFGREARDTYGESLAGVCQNLATYAIDPFNKPGDAKSGLIPLLQDLPMAPEGSADKLTMGYGFRWKFSTGEDRLPIDKPDDYDPRLFELYRRGFQKRVNMATGRRMRKLDQFEPEGGHIYAMGAGNLARALWAPTVFGCNADYPDGDYATRSRIWKFHQDFMRGITHFLRTDPDAPANQKASAMKIGFMPGIFDDTVGWPHQLYVREARRMKSAYIVTQKDLEGTTDPADSVGLASYGVDDWPYATFPFEGGVALQGGYFSMLYLDQQHKGIYKIPYRAITPLRNECDNLLVPVCCSASHIAMTSIRMEPVWMILGQSAAVAASMAIQRGRAVQDVEYAKLRSRLVELEQRLDRPA